MEYIIRQESCSDCPYKKIRKQKIKQFLKAVSHYNFCRDEVLGGEPLLSEIEEEMVRGLIAQQAASETGKTVVDTVHLVGSIAESGGDDNRDFMTRVICWIGMQRQQEELAQLEQEINASPCGIVCLQQIGE
jgi:hypothetical protein